MKSSVVLAIAGAIAINAQTFPSDTPQCVITCGQSMFAKAAEFGCNSPDPSCLCGAQNFRNGVHDCSHEACVDVSGGAEKGEAWGSSLCAGIPITDLPSGPGGATSVTTGIPVTTEIATTVVSGGSTFVSTLTSTFLAGGGAPGASGTAPTGDVTPTAIATSSYVSVITSDSVTSTVSGVTTIFGVNGTPLVPSNSQTTVTSPLVSTGVSGSSTFLTTTGSTTLTTSVTDSGSASSTESSGDASSSSSSGLAAQKTAGPMVGILAAAGLAAALL